MIPLIDKNKYYKIFGFDIETFGDKNLFYLGSLYSKDETSLYFSKEEMINKFYSLCTQKSDNLILATNLAFDFFGVFTDTKHFKNISLCFRDSELITAKLKYDKKTLLFLDTFNFAHYSVATLGKIINIDKLPKPVNIGKIPQNEDELNYLIKYNINDSKITCLFGEFLQDSFRKLGVQLSYTIASTSLNLFRNKYLDSELNQPDKYQIDFQKLGYYGGRTEAFKRGKIKDLLYYDFNSLYPAQYLKEFPNPNTRKWIFESDNSYLEFEGVSFCDIIAPKIKIPFLPVRYDDKLLFPIGKFSGVYSHLELRKALGLGYKIKVRKSIIYLKTFKPFKDFGIDLYNLRMKYKKENNPFQLPVKILLNSLYGKFAQHYVQAEIDYLEKYTEDQVKDMINNPNINVTLVDKFIYMEHLNKKIPSFVFPIFSLYVTAYARIQLYETFESLKFDNVYYCDTDSVITNIILPESTELGKLKLEHKIKEGIIVKPKMYAFLDENNKTIIRMKGVPSSFFKDYHHFVDWLDKPKVDYIRFVKFKQAIKSKEENKYGKLSINQKIDIKKSISLNDDKRVWPGNFNKFILENSKPINIKI